MLFVGPFRYRPNRDGIERFLREAWPRVRQAVPDATHHDSRRRRMLDRDARRCLFAQAGVAGPRAIATTCRACSREARSRSIRWWASAGPRSSSSRRSPPGRVCVTTTEGARGFAVRRDRVSSPSPTCGAMAEPIVALLRDASRRHALERPDPAALDAFGWHHSVARLRALIDDALAATTASHDSTTSTWRRTCASTTSRSTPTSARASRGRVLEVGCGNGRDTAAVAARGHDAYGMDASAPMLRELARKAASVGCRCAPRARMRAACRFARATFGCVLLSLLARHVCRGGRRLRSAFLRGVHDALLPNGLVVLDAFVPRPVDVQAELQARLQAPVRRIHARAREAHHAASRWHQSHRAPVRARQRRRRTSSRRSRSPKSSVRARPPRCRPRWSTPDSSKIRQPGTTARARRPTERSSSR